MVIACPWRDSVHYNLIERLLAHSASNREIWHDSSEKSRLAITYNEWSDAVGAARDISGILFIMTYLRQISPAGWTTCAECIPDLINALVAWPEAAYMLESDTNELLTVAKLGISAAVLLYTPALAIQQAKFRINNEKD